jgi:branched-chain amino acid transport system substrate-binding protein
MSIFTNRLTIASAAFFMLAASCSGTFAQKKYDPGATDTEIKIGNIMAYSGPAAAYGVIGKVEDAYFKMINDQGGINGRKINFITYDDGYSPPKAVEQVRKLVESDEVLFVFGSLGTPSNSAIQKYLNFKKIPQLFVASGANKWNDPKQFPWSMGFQPSYRVEGRVFARYILKAKPDAKVAVFYQNDDFGKDYVAGLKDVFGSKASSIIIVEESYETTEPSIDSHIVKLKGTGADILVNISTPKFAAQTIKKMGELNWKPMHLMTNVSSSIGAVMKPAGLETSNGNLSAGYLKDASDPRWNDDGGMKRFMSFVGKYMPGTNISDTNLVYGYIAAQTMVQVLKQAGDDLTRENVMKQAASLKDFIPDTLLPGIRINTSAADFAPVEQLQMMRFEGEKWVFFGPVIAGELNGAPASSNAPVVIPQPAPSPQIVAAPAPPPPATVPAPAPQTAMATPATPILPSPSAARADPGRRVALVIGNSAYTNAPLLPNPSRDALAMGKAFRDLGFQKVVVATDLTREKLIDTLRAFASEADNADWAVVYFAGHGIEMGGTNYLIPVDAKLQTDRDVDFEAIPIEKVMNAVDGARKLRLVLLDACRENPFANQMRRTTATRSIGRGLARVEPEAGMLLVYAAKHGETALDGNGTNSPFVSALIERMKEPGLEVRRLFDIVRDDVMTATNNHQTPFTYGSVSGRSEFFFVAGK